MAGTQVQHCGYEAADNAHLKVVALLQDPD